MFPSSRFAAQSAIASQLMNQRPPLPSGPPARARGPEYDPYPVGGTQPRGGPSYPQASYVPAPHPSIFSSAASAADSANRRQQQQGSITPQPGRSGNLGSAQAAHAHNLQQARSNPNFRGGMPLPGQTRPRPPMSQQQQQPGSSGIRAPDGPYPTGTLAIGGRRVASPPGNLSPPVQQGGFGHGPAYPSGPQANSGFSRTASPNRSPLPLGPNSPRSPVLGESRVASPRPSTMFDAGQAGSGSTLPRRPSSHHDPPTPADELGVPPDPTGTMRGGHGRFATEGASPSMPTVDLAPPPPYMPSPEIQPSSPVSVPTLSEPLSPDAAARESAYGGLFDYMVNETADVPGSVSPNSTATGESTEIGYRLAARASSATGPASPIGGDDTDDDDSDDDTGTNALFLPQRPIVKSAPASARPAPSDDGEDAGDSTFTSQMRQLVLDNGGDTFRSDESTLGPSGRLSNRSLPPIDTSGTASEPTPASAIHTTPQEMAEAQLPPVSASPERDTPESGGAIGDEQLSTATHLRRKKTVFEKNEDKQWAFRPPAEQVVRELSKFFPEINLEAEFIEADGSPAGETFGTTAAASAAAEAAAAESATRETKLRNRKSIRRVAEERQRGDLPAASTLLSTTQLRPPVDVKVIRRRSTRMWGGKVEEVKPGTLKGQLGAVTSETAEAARTSPMFYFAGHAVADALSCLAATFKWVKGDLIGKGAVSRLGQAIFCPRPHADQPSCDSSPQYGRVYLGLNATTGEMLAVKQVEVPSTMSDRVDDRQSQVIAALRSEIQLLKDLDHPNVVQYLGFEESPDFISIFLEYVPGGAQAGGHVGRCLRSWSQLLTPCPPCPARLPRECLPQVRQARGGRSAVVHASDPRRSRLPPRPRHPPSRPQGRQHPRRPQQPRRRQDHRLWRLEANSCVAPPWRVSTVPLEQHLALTPHSPRNAVEEATQMGGTLMTGSLYWMAPEVVTNAGQGYNSKIDLWSLGCVVLEMLSGARPWQGLEMMPIILKVRSSIELRHSLSTPSADVEPSFPFVARSRRTASDAGRSRSFARGGRLRLRQVVRR